MKKLLLLFVLISLACGVQAQLPTATTSPVPAKKAGYFAILQPAATKTSQCGWTVIVGLLYVRKEDNDNSAVLGVLHNGDVRTGEIYINKDMETWLKHDGGYSAIMIGTKEFMRSCGK